MSGLRGDLHNDFLLFLLLTRKTGAPYDFQKRHRAVPFAPFGHTDLPRLKQSGLDYLGCGVVPNPFFSNKKSALEQLSILEELVSTNPELAWMPERSPSKGKIHVFAGIEGAHALSGESVMLGEELEEFYSKGVRYLTLAHFTRNAACHPASRPNEPLTRYGKDLVKTLNETRIIVDLSHHVSYKAFFEVCEASAKPVIASHASCYTIGRHPRGLRDEQIKEIAGAGGVVGVIFAPLFLMPWYKLWKVPFTDPAKLVVDHMDYIGQLLGSADNIAFGSDYDGWVPFGMGAKLKDVSFLPRVDEELERRGYSALDRAKIAGENFLRVYDNR